MRLNHGIHLGYCTNIHRGESWEETFASLRDHTLEVKRAVCPDAPFAIGLRLSAKAAEELSRPGELTSFRHWLDQTDTYVVTINGFPYGQFHQSRVKEEVYRPDWTTPERLEYTKLLFRILTEISPDQGSLSVSTLPGSFKEFLAKDEGRQRNAIFSNLLRCHEFLADLSASSGQDLHLGLEPEPLGLFETSQETTEFFSELLDATSLPEQDVLQTLGVNYDTCHLAVEYEEAADAIHHLTGAGLRISKLHLSSALALTPSEESLARLKSYEEPVYLHQVIQKDDRGRLSRFRDLDEAFSRLSTPDSWGEEWRIHFHVPLHASPRAPFRDTRNHLLAAFDVMQKDPSLCTHWEMETYTWEVLPPDLRSNSVDDQLIKEYEWTLNELRSRQLAS
ncbi:MAG: metabolite traffic protein EboE [Verrucomicrobiota bacterium]